jgi:fumarate hydratase class II
MIKALGVLKKAAAMANADLDRLRHAEQHECERGHFEPRHRDRRR